MRGTTSKVFSEPSKALAGITSGQRVFIASACGEPQTLVEALLVEADRLRDVVIVTGLQGSSAPYVDERYWGSFRLEAFMSSPRVKRAMREGEADYIPTALSQIPALLSSGAVPLDVALVQLSPPDDDGFCSLGVNVSYIGAAIQSAAVVIAEINDQMPRTRGDTLVHASDIDVMLESSRPVLEVPPREADPVLEVIGAHVASLVPDRATMQVGVGGIADAVWHALSDRTGLGIHSGSVSDGIVDLVRDGVVTNEHKTLSPGRVVCGQLIGTRRLYDFAHENDLFELRAVDYTHSPATLAGLRDLVCVNSAVQVDLRGQVNSETLGGTQIAGVGGAIDFATGAKLSPGGISVVALPSTASQGRYSRVVHSLDAGVVTLPATVVDYVVTEHGIASLRGKTLRERAREMIKIAAPDFRSDLSCERK